MFSLMIIRDPLCYIAPNEKVSLHNHIVSDLWTEAALQTAPSLSYSGSSSADLETVRNSVIFQDLARSTRIASNILEANGNNCRHLGEVSSTINMSSGEQPVQ
jgi:hypothetical protein